MGLITTGHKHAILTKGPVAFSSAWLWQWKNRIDQAFMRKFGADLPAMQQSTGAFQLSQRRFQLPPLSEN